MLVLEILMIPLPKNVEDTVFIAFNPFTFPSHCESDGAF